jgi:hypothetical protein
MQAIRPFKKLAIEEHGGYFINNSKAQRRSQMLLRNSMQSMEMSFFVMPFYGEAMQKRHLHAQRKVYFMSNSEA